jgi:competence ComEA-like helix-hairpin-helix protein
MLRFFRFLILALALSPMAATVATAANLVNVNTASVPTLRTVKGIDTSRANAIVRYRETHGRFNSVNDLIRVPGINTSTLNRIRPQVTVGNVRRPPPPPPHHHQPQHRR